MIVAEVPLKVTLFGEHAVVYGEPALAMTISEKMVVRVRESDKTVISSPTLSVKGLKVSLNDLKVESEETNRILSYVIKALDYFGKKRDALIEIDSPVEPSVGLGTSAATIVGVVAAYSRFLGYELTKEEIAKISREVELSVQGLGSRMDTYTISLGGIIYFPRGAEGYERVKGDVKLVVGYVRRYSTTKDILRRVKGLKERNESLFKEIISTIGKVVDEAKKALEEGNEEKLGELMYINHGLLMSLGVTSPTVDNLVSTARLLGIKGCKMSGGGGGGAIICTKDVKSEILLNSIGAVVVSSEKSNEGVTIKEIS
ncbi:MAG: mevalonate kinase [Candidatus Aramenus sulfurataquae]|jgi:mevalonate kinase|uniref:Mevalonate kinase n=2 Tax=Candidatus Aramenus sulfurataquae TaxID=1326980 RepID=A0A0F2LNW8_9CREN|nr:mevalonate kinase [Candidatus Aramenus sulfurataquae]